MIHYSWWEPPQDDPRDNDVLVIGDQVKAKAGIPYNAGRIGTLTAISDYGYTVSYGDGMDCTYDRDMIVKVEEKSC